MNLETQTKRSFRFLQLIVVKHLQKYFSIWSFRNKYLTSKIPRYLKKIALTISPDQLPQKSEKRTPRTPRSPIDISNRLYSRAKEIQQKRDTIQKTKTLELTLTPKLHSFTSKWQQIKNSTLKAKPMQEPLAVVSAQATLISIQSPLTRSLTPII